MLELLKSNTKLTALVATAIISGLTVEWRLINDNATLNAQIKYEPVIIENLTLRATNCCDTAR